MVFNAKELRQLTVGPVIVICLSGWKNITSMILYGLLSTFVHKIEFVLIYKRQKPVSIEA